jgi:hypothetical protein
MKLGGGVDVEDTIFRRNLFFEGGDLTNERAVDCFQLVGFAPTPSTRTTGRTPPGGQGEREEEGVAYMTSPWVRSVSRFAIASVNGSRGRSSG